MATKVEKTEKEAKTAKVVKPRVVKAAKPKVAKAVKAPKVAEEKAVKEVAEVKEAPVKAEKKVTEKYFYAVGRRKTSVAQVRLFEHKNSTDADMVVNGKKLSVFFPTASTQAIILAPLKTAGLAGDIRMTVLVRGGGFTGQADAVKLGIARALVKMDETLRKSIKSEGFLTRDSREVERKKPGLKKARRAPQWAKR
jgi:small subunit ribosomal protein S9